MVRSLVRALALVVSFAALGLGPSAARADHPLSLSPRGATALKVDGDLGDFRGARFAELGDDADGSLEYALAYDEQALYLGARVYDDELVRTGQPGPREDAVVLTLVMPRAHGQPLVSEVWLFAGIPGKQAGSAAIGAPGERPRASRDVAVVEGPLAGPHARKAGYVLEARIAWSAVPGGREAGVGRGSIRLSDVDGDVGAKPSVIASAVAAKAAALPHLLMADGPNVAVQSFFAAKQLAPGSVRFDLTGQVAGDARLDRVVVAGTFAIVAGPGIDERGGYHYVDLPVTSSAGVLSAELRELTGDGLLELVLRMRQQNDLGKRDMLQVMALSPGQPRPVFSLELQKETDAGSVQAELRFDDRAPPGFEVARRVYRWDGRAFAVEREDPKPRAARGDQPSTASPTRSDDEPERVVHQEPPGAEALVAAFREAQGIDPAQRARFVQHANVAEDRRIESLMLFDKYLLVVGDGYRGGTGYFYFGLPVQGGADVQRVFTADVTGDGRRELFVRHKQLVGDVQREILLVYAFAGESMELLAQVEVRRAQGSSSVGNVVDIVSTGRHWALRVSPGVAHGWGAASYPFVAESTDGYGPLLLPWKDRAQLYRFERDGLVAGPSR